MISVLTQKLAQTSRIVREEKKCLRNRLRGSSCQRCVVGCSSKALVDNFGKISFNSGTCTSCGVCVASCPGEAFSFEGFSISEALHEKTKGKGLVVSCYRCGYRSENELRLPCVGVLPLEALLFLGLRGRGDVLFNLSECSECANRAATDSFVKLFQFTQKRVCHLFPSQLMVARLAADLPPQKEHDRRQFLFSLGENVVDVVQKQFARKEGKKEKTLETKRIPARTQLFNEILQDESAKRYELIEICTPDAKVSPSCTRCPRCTGMCPTGALKIKRNGSEKVLSYDRALCSACGLCVEFCKEEAISIRKPVMS